MFRDDLKAAVARAEQLERALAEAEERADSAEQELEQLRGKLRFAERELEQLRLHQAPEDHQPAPLRRRLFPALAGVALMLLIAGGIAAYLHIAFSDPPPDAPRSSKAPAARAAVPLESTGSIERVLLRLRRDCQVSRRGSLRSCKPKDLPKQLRVAEERVGAQSAAKAYCKLLVARDDTLQALAAHRLGGFYTSRVEALDATIFRCLDRYVRAGGEHRKRLASIWAKIGARLGHSEAIARYLRSAPKEVRYVGLRGLWAYGRLKVLPEFRRYLESDAQEQVETALRALTDLRGAAEHRAVCPLIARTVARNAARQRVAARATYTLALVCHQTHTKLVLDIVERASRDAAYRASSRHVGGGSLSRPRARPSFDYWWLAAVGSCTHPYRKPTPEARRRALALARRLARDTSLRPLRRAQALRVIGEIDPVAGRAAAQRLPKDAPKALRRAAARLLRR